MASQSNPAASRAGTGGAKSQSDYDAEDADSDFGGGGAHFDAWGRPVVGGGGGSGSGARRTHTTTSIAAGVAVYLLRGINALLFLLGVLLQTLGRRHDNSMLEGGDRFAYACCRHCYCCHWLAG